MPAPGHREIRRDMLERIKTECVFDFECGELAVGTIGLDKEFSILAKKARRHAMIVKARVLKIAEHRLFGSVLHGEIVLGAAP
jgi:hypothetical protein